MLVQLIQKTSEPYGWEVWLRNGTHVVLLRIFRHGTEALKYASDVAELVSCEVQYGYETVVLRLCTKDELWERMDD